MSSKRLVLGALGALALAGCAETHAGLEPIDPAGFGEANRQTYAAMVVDPDPQYDGPMATSAEHAEQAVQRYREDKVKQPETISSTESVGGE